MQIDVKKFAAEIRELLETGECHWEIKMYGPGLLEEVDKTFSRSSVILIGQRILMHHFGEILAARFKKWIDANYEIGCDERAWNGSEADYEVHLARLGTKGNDGRREAA